MKSYTDEEVKQAYEIIKTHDSESMMIKEAPRNSALIEKFAKELLDMNFREHMNIFHDFKKFTRERMATEIKKLESEYTDTKEKCNCIDEFLKINNL